MPVFGWGEDTTASPSDFPELFTVDSFADTNPNAMGQTYSSSYTGFGPGDYSGGYTGEGDRVYWGPYDAVSTVSGSNASIPVHFGPSYIGRQGIGALSSTGSTVLEPPSQTTSVAADASSTGSTQLGVTSEQSAVVQPASTEVPTSPRWFGPAASSWGLWGPT